MLSCTRETCWRPIPSDGAANVRVCGMWRGLREALGALSLSLLVEEGRSTFVVMEGIWAKF